MLYANETWIQIICLVFALVQMFLTFKYFFKIKSFFKKLNKDYARKIEAVFGYKVDQ